jgi:hypothetical protein
MFGRKKQADKPSALPIAQTVPKYGGSPAFALQAQTHAERSLYAALRRSVPVIDAAIGKIVRLLGSFRIVTDDPSAQAEADCFAREVMVNGSAQGLAAFVWDYMDCLLTYGEAVGEMLPDAGQNGVCALYSANPDDVRITAGSSPMELLVCRADSTGKPLENQSLLIASLLRQKRGTVRGTSLLEGLPFVSEILLRILQSIKNNWERAGDLRFAVTYDPKDGNFSEESARLIADEWKKAMRGDSVCDFVSVGDVRVRVIGAENQMPDCQVPVRVLLEQIVAKLGIPPFLLGFSWSSTEHMSVQQADILTSELEYYRMTAEPAVRKIVQTHLRLAGYGTGFSLVWNDINLQDAVELSQARLNNARAAQLEKQYGLEVCDA